MMSKNIKIMNTIIIVLSAVLVISCAVFMNSYRKTAMYYYDTDNYLNYIGYKEYYKLVNIQYRARKPIEQARGTMKECLAVAGYYESASLYKVHLETQNIVKAREYQSRMQRYESMMGELDYTASEIRDELGIEYRSIN